MVEAVSGRLLSSARSDRAEVAWPSPWFLHVVAILRWALSLGLLALLGWGLSVEARTSYLQSRIFSHFAENTSFTVRPGQSKTIVFPKRVRRVDHSAWLRQSAVLHRIAEGAWLLSRTPS